MLLFLLIVGLAMRIENSFFPLPLWEIERSVTHRVERSEMHSRVRERGNLVYTKEKVAFHDKEKNMIDSRLLEILACPACKGDLIYDKENQKLICEKCRLKFTIKDDIPIMLLDQAEKY